MSALAARRMALRLTVPFARGADTLELELQPAANPSMATIAAYEFADHEALFDSRPVPRYVLLVRQDLPVATAVTVNYAVLGPLNPQTRQRPQLRTGSVSVSIAAGTPAGSSSLLDFGADEGSDTQLSGISVTPPPPSGVAADWWSLTALLGNLSKLLWVIGGERDRLRAQLERVTTQQHLAQALRFSLDILGSDLGVPRFPPLPYAYDADAVALYHLDDRAQAGQEVDVVVDAMAQYGLNDHPGQNVGKLARSGAPGRFAGSFAFRNANAVIRIVDHADFALAATDSFTIECFVKPDSGAADGHVIAKHANPANTADAGWALSIGAFGRGIARNSRFLLSDGTRQVTLFADQSLGTDRFFHVAGVIDRALGEARLSVDGVLLSRQPLANLGALTNSEPINLGLCAGSPYRGLLDEVRLSRVARSSFHPVLGESDDNYRRRLSIFQRWTLPTPGGLLQALNEAVGPVGGDPSPLILNDANAALVGGARTVRVIPLQLAPGECIDAGGNRNSTEAAVNGSPADEATFDAAYLLDHNDARVDYSPPPSRTLAPGELAPDTHKMQLVTERVLDQLLTLLGGGGRLQILSGFDPRADDLRQVGRGLLLAHTSLDLGRLAARAHVAGFSFVCYRVDLGAVSASVAAGEYLDIQVTGGSATPGNGFALLLSQTVQLAVRPALPAGAGFHWVTIACGQGRAQFTTAVTGPTATLEAVAPGDLLVKVEATWRHVATGSRNFRVGLADLADGGSIAGDGTLGVTTDVAAQPDDFFHPAYLVTHQDDRVNYGAAVNNRRMQPAVAQRLDQLLQLIAATGAAGQLELLSAWTPGSGDLHAVGRALTLRHAALGGGRLAALAFVAGFTYVARQGNQVEAQQAPADLLTPTGAVQVLEGATIPLAMQPVASPVALALGQGVVYVANQVTDTVSALDPAGGAVQWATKVGWQPAALALSPDAKRLYTADSAGNSVTVLDSATGRVIGSVAVAGGPVALAPHPTQARLYVACGAGGSVAAIDTTALTVTGTVAVGNHPTALAVTPNGNEVWVALDSDRKVTFLSTTPFGVTASIALTESPLGLSIAPDGAHGYLTFPSSGHLVVANVATRTVGAPLALGSGAVPGAATVGPDGTVYVAAGGAGGGRIFALKADGTPIGSAGVGRQPAALAVTADRVAVANTTDNTVSVLDPRRFASIDPRNPPLLATWPLGSGLGERRSWVVRAGAAAQAQLSSTTAPATTLRGLRAGPVLVRAVYALRDNPDPYSFEVRLKPALEAANAVIRKEQYDLAMNALNVLHPVGVEVMTRALRNFVVELRNQELDPFPDYTYPDFRGRGPTVRRQ